MWALLNSNCHFASCFNRWTLLKTLHKINAHFPKNNSLATFLHYCHLAMIIETKQVHERLFTSLINCQSVLWSFENQLKCVSLSYRFRSWQLDKKKISIGLVIFVKKWAPAGPRLLHLPVVTVRVKFPLLERRLRKPLQATAKTKNNQLARLPLGKEQARDQLEPLVT